MNLYLTKRKKIKERTLSQSRKRAWDAFSKFIRLRDCLKTMKRTDYAMCITCGKITPWRNKQLQAGHFIPGRGNAVLFDELGVNAQCYDCNINKGGLPLIYRKIMVERHGEEVVNQLELKYYKTRKLYKGDYDLIYFHYKKLYEQLKNEQGGLLCTLR